MLYGSKLVLDNRVATLMAAADTVDEFTVFTSAVLSQAGGQRNWEETYASSLLDHMQNASYRGFKHSVLAVYHVDEAQREDFWKEWGVQEVASEPLRDRHLDMLHAKNQQIQQQDPEESELTIEQRTGLDKNDPWDRRSEEQKEADKQAQAQFEQARSKGLISGDSFSDAAAQRAARPQKVAEEGAYGRSQAIEALKDLVDDTVDYEAMDNAALQRELSQAGVPDVKGVYDDGKVPQRLKDRKVETNVWDVNTVKAEDGTISIQGIVAGKIGGEVDEEAKAANEKAYEDKVNEAKGDKTQFSPEDFARALSRSPNDNSAPPAKDQPQAQSEEEPAQQTTEQSEESDQASPAQQATPVESQTPVESSEGQDTGEADGTPGQGAEVQVADHQPRPKLAEREADQKARRERDAGIFRGSDLYPDDEDTIDWEDLPQNVQDALTGAGLRRDRLEVKDYPMNSMVGGRVLLPFDGLRTQDGIRYVGGVNLLTEGTVSMSGPGVIVAIRPNATQDGWAIFGRDDNSVWLVRVERD
jgi:hypothetical protein